MRIPEIARFLLIGGREIVFAPETETAVADIPIFIVGTVFGILLHQREQAVLHASAVLVFFLTPLLAIAALGLLRIAVVLFVPTVRRACRIGRSMSRGNLSLLDMTAQFLGGLKLAMSQNLQAGFVAEFRQSLRELTRRQVEFIRVQSRSRVALSTLTALAGAAEVLIGLGVFDVDAPTLIALLVIMTRMTAPVGQFQRGIQQLANALPAYET